MKLPMRSLVFLSALLSFLILACFVTMSRELAGLDQRVSDGLTHHAHASAALAQLFAWITMLGNSEILTAVCLGVLAGLLYGRQWAWAGVWVAAGLGVGLLSIWLKSGFARNRPDPATALAAADGWSFPSGHAMGSLVIYGLLAYLIVADAPKNGRRQIVLASAAILILAIGFSRIYLGVHWPSDVVGGFLIGTAWLIPCIAACEQSRHRSIKK